MLSIWHSPPPKVEKDLEKLGWTKIKTGNTMSLYGNANVNPGPGHGIIYQ